MEIVNATLLKKQRIFAEIVRKKAAVEVLKEKNRS
jgi:hypothetical protein